jgi:NAD-dependent deacetylase
LRLDPASAACVRILTDASSIVVSTGAGISAESGIPTFRDAPNALWANYDPHQLATREGFRRDPALVWRWYADRREVIAHAEPNPGHLAIAALETMFDSFTLVTQNIDNLHRKAGSANPIEVHGNIFRYKCFDKNHPIDTLPDGKQVPPRCHCGSAIRPDVVWFGELPAPEIERAYEALKRCDAILVVGTSGTVYPAAGFAEVAKQVGAKVIVVNPEPTPQIRSDVFLQGPAGEILPAVLRAMKKGRRS